MTQLAIIIFALCNIILNWQYAYFCALSVTSECTRCKVINTIFRQILLHCVRVCVYAFVQRKKTNLFTSQELGNILYFLCANLNCIICQNCDVNRITASNNCNLFLWYMYFLSLSLYPLSLSVCVRALRDRKIIASVDFVSMPPRFTITFQLKHEIRLVWFFEERQQCWLNKYNYTVYALEA